MDWLKGVVRAVICRIAPANFWGPLPQKFHKVRFMLEQMLSVGEGLAPPEN